MIRLFPPQSSETFLGTEFSKGTIDSMRQDLITQLKIIQNKQTTITGPILKPYNRNDLEGLWTNVPAEMAYIVIVIGRNDSFIGSELALDFSRDNQIQVRSVSSDNPVISTLVNSDTDGDIYVVKRDLKVMKLHTESMNRTLLIKAVKDFFHQRGFNITVDLPSTAIGSTGVVDLYEVMAVMKIEDDIKKRLKTKQLSSIVFQLDLEGALTYSLRNEIPLHKNITGEMLDALKKYIHVLIKYFPIGKQGVKLLKRLRDEVITNKTYVKGQDFRESVMNFERDLYPVFLPKQGWLGCRGSKLEYRGYPCGLWTMFHTLTIFAESKHPGIMLKPAYKGREVLDAMTGYIKHFFTCSDCADHFLQMTPTIVTNVTTYNDSILWLWETHNKVNARLAGDQTEDPEHKKVQFPPSNVCPQCRDETGHFIPESILQFLKNMYTNISYIQVNPTKPTPKKIEEPKYSNNLRHENIGQDNGFEERTLNTSQSKRLSWDFNIFDISLCVFLYICSVTILIVVCIKFVFKRSYRKKTYVYDILSKV